MTKEWRMRIPARQEKRYALEEGGEFVVAAPVRRRVLRRAGRAAKKSVSVLLNGETGTGKSMLAKWIHKRSSRSGGPFIGASCAAIPETLIESELFGHERGAFTGAHQTRIGRFEAAQDGTLFLDEVGDAPLTVQIKLLRALQERAIERVGGDGQPIPVNIRLIAATNRDLRAGMKDGSFRNDLYYRLNTFEIEIPPLRERREDIPPLINAFAKKYADNGEPVQFSADAMAILLQYDYPGNVRELENAVERASVFAEDGPAQADSLPEDMTRSGDGAASHQPADRNEDSGAQMSLPDAVERLERTMIEQALRATRGVQSRAAKRLGITERGLRYKLKKYGFDSDGNSTDETS